MVAVAITQDRRDITKAIVQALDLLNIGGLIRGKRVAIKPNETWASKEDITAVTQADTLSGVLQYVKRLEPGQLVVTGGAGAAETEDVLRLAGMMDVIEREGVELVDHNRPPFEEVELTYAPERDVMGPQKSVMVNPRVLEYETLISLAQLKVHATATVTLTMKNVAMSLPAADYYGHPRSRQVHKHDFFKDMHSFIAGMIYRFPIALGIIVGHPAMVGTGPIGGKTVETGLVIASTDALAADTVGAKLLGFKLQGVRHLWEAARLSIGQTDTDKMEFPGMPLQSGIDAFTSAVYGEKLDI